MGALRHRPTSGRTSRSKGVGLFFGDRGLWTGGIPQVLGGMSWLKVDVQGAEAGAGQTRKKAAFCGTTGCLESGKAWGEGWS